VTARARESVADFTVTNHGTLCLFEPQNDAAREHLEEHVQEDAQWWAGSLVVEPRYVIALVEAVRDAGFTVGGAA
jgi:hypothetical protein